MNNKRQFVGDAVGRQMKIGQIVIGRSSDNDNHTLPSNRVALQLKLRLYEHIYEKY